MFPNDLGRLRTILATRSWPEVEIGLSWGTDALKVRKKMLARIKEPGILVMTCPLELKAHLMASESERFFETDHYRGFPALLVRMSEIDDEDLGNYLELAWRSLASRDALVQYDWLREDPAGFERLKSIVSRLGLTHAIVSREKPWVFEVSNKGFVWFKEPGVWVIRCPLQLKVHLMAERPETFFDNDHFRGYDGVFARIDNLDDEELSDIVQEAHRIVGHKLAKRGAKRA